MYCRWWPTGGKAGSTSQQRAGTCDTSAFSPCWRAMGCRTVCVGVGRAGPFFACLPCPTISAHLECAGFSQYDFINRGQFQYVKKGGAVPSKSQGCWQSWAAQEQRADKCLAPELHLGSSSLASQVRLGSAAKITMLWLPNLQRPLCLYIRLQSLLSLTYFMVY